MRLKNLILCLLLCIASASAKDVITKTDGTKLDAKVEEITETLIKYRKASNPTGPVYTIPLEFVASIQYENGEVEEYNNPLNIAKENQSSSFYKDDELLRIFNKDKNSNKTMSISPEQEVLLKKAKTYRLIGYVGGPAIVVGGIVAGIIAGGGTNTEILVGSSIGVVAGAIWCTCFNLKANSLIKQAWEMQLYSTTIIENEIYQFGDNSLTAGINLMGNRMVNSHSIGLSLGLNF